MAKWRDYTVYEVIIESDGNEVEGDEVSCFDTEENAREEAELLNAERISGGDSDGRTIRYGVRSTLYLNGSVLGYDDITWDELCY